MKRQYTTPEGVCHIGPHEWEAPSPDGRKGHLSPRASDYASESDGVRLCREHYIEAFREVYPEAEAPSA